MTIFRLPLALSLTGHIGAFALLAWLGTAAPSVPDPGWPQSIPLLFIELPAAADASAPDAQAAAAAPQGPPAHSRGDAAPTELATEASSAKMASDPPPDPLSAPPVSERSEPPAAPSAAAEPVPPESPAAATPPDPPLSLAAPTPRTHPASPPLAAENAAMTLSSATPAGTRKRQHAAATAPAASRDSDRAPNAGTGQSASARPVLSERRSAPAIVTPSVAPPSSPVTVPAYPVPSQLASLPPHAAAPAAAPPFPAPAVAAAISAEYQQALSIWLERNKISPDAARRAGEEGSALLRFRVRRDGYVLAYQLVRSTGHAALDAAVEQMMGGARLPPFPASMTQPEIAVSVPIRFNLSR